MIKQMPGIVPGDICLQNCVHLISDERRRLLASEARKFADGGARPRKHWRKGNERFDRVYVEHEKLFWNDTYWRRLARLQRLKEY